MNEADYPEEIFVLREGFLRPPAQSAHRSPQMAAP